MMVHRWMSCALALIIVPLSFLVAACVCALAGERTYTTVDVTSSLKKREQQMSVLVVEWEDTIIAPVTSSKAKLAQRIGKPVGSDHHLMERNIVKMKADKWRMDSVGRPKDKSADIPSQDQTTVFKDGILKTYMPPGIIEHPLGNIDKADPTVFPKAANIQPVFFLLRPLTAGLVIPKSAHVLKDRVPINGNSCVVMERKSGDDVWHVFFAVDLDLSLIRWTITREGVLVIRSDIEYRKDDKAGLWLPATWRTVFTSLNGETEQSVSGVALQWNVGGGVTDSDFVFDFPPGTLVRDFTTKSTYSDNTQYIPRADGTKRIVTSDDKGRTYNELLSTDSARNKPGIGGNAWLLVVVSLAIVTTSAVLLVYKRRRRVNN